MINFQPFPTLQADSILLRKINSSDQIAVFQGLSDAKVIKYYGVEYHSYLDTKAQMEWYDELLKTKTGIWWAITTPEINDMIGACGFNNLQIQHQKAELGYWLMPTYWQKGIMRKALQAILNFAFKEMGLHRVEAYVETENKASGKLLQSLNFQHEGTLQDCEIKKNRFISLDIYARLQ